MKFQDPLLVLAKADQHGLRRVLVVTALPSEMAAVRKHTTHIASCQGRDGNVNELGNFAGTDSQWLVVVVESGAGNHHSQGVVTNACIEFGPFELILFVGVAATRKVDDAAIGSVVVSSHVYLASVGKYKDGEFFPRAREFPINPRLLGFGKKSSATKSGTKDSSRPMQALRQTTTNTQARILRLPLSHQSYQRKRFQPT
jgi:hypothetical protein